jgi:hypothetical protein
MQATEKTSINEIAKVHARLVQSAEDLTAAVARHGEVENEYGGLLEQFVVATARQAGLMHLPLAVIQAGIRYLAIVGDDPAVVAEWNATPGVAEAPNVPTGTQADASRSTRRRSRRPGPGQALVSVKITKGEGEKCAPSLRDSGLKWDGKHIGYRGIVDAGDVNVLCARFPTCVIVDRQGQLDDVLSGAPDGNAGANGSPLMTPEPSPTDFDAGPVAGSDDPQIAAEDPQPRAEAAEAGSEASDEVAGPKSEDVGLPQATGVDPRPQTRPPGISPFSRLPARPAPKSL